MPKTPTTPRSGYMVEQDTSTGLWMLLYRSPSAMTEVWDIESEHATEADAKAAQKASEREDAEARAYDRTETQMLGRMMGETDDLDDMEDPVMLMVDAAGELADREPDDDRCPNPKGHEWHYTGSAYGGDDDSYHGEGRCYCIHCGADGDA